MRRLRRQMVMLAIPVCSVGVACDASTADDAAAPLAFMADAIATLPSLPDSAGGQALTVQPLAVGDAFADAGVRKLFRLECHDDVGNSDCPAGIPVDGTTKYSSDTLLGNLAGAQSFTNEILTKQGAGSCGVGTGGKTGTVSSNSFATADVGGEATRYLVADFDGLDCISSLVAGGDTRHIAWQRPSPTLTKTVTTAKREDLDGHVQSLIAQSTTLLDEGGRARVLAVNTVTLTTHPSGPPSATRVLVLADLITHRFVAKNQDVAAVGIGGLSPTNVRHAGAWLAFNDETGETTCVDNATLQVADASACAGEQAVVDGGDIASWFALSATDGALLAAWLPLFAAPTAVIPAGRFPAAEGDIVHFPDDIR